MRAGDPLSEIELLNPYSNAKEKKATETKASFIDGGEIASAYLHYPRARVNKVLSLNYNKAMDMYMMIKVLTDRRLSLQGKLPLSAAEFVPFLSDCAPVSQEENDEYRVRTASRIDQVALFQ
ncbi:hypothetical protein AVEN_188748-1 [Araneus ventricosus]|uniref:Uncharacterized protein n=1 Tax=Araneus ventricosus TaxID=182803 RepID=A0A4Y2U6B0_ARAVE|nr:hypothetical protein AVEN_188748-1 [Araneus ventricosus]